MTNDLGAVRQIAGPAIIIEPHQTVVVEAGWQAEVTAKNHLVLARVGPIVRLDGDIDIAHAEDFGAHRSMVPSCTSTA